MNSDQNQFKAKKTSPSLEFEGEKEKKLLQKRTQILTAKNTRLNDFQTISRGLESRFDT